MEQTRLKSFDYIGKPLAGIVSTCFMGKNKLVKVKGVTLPAFNWEPEVFPAATHPPAKTPVHIILRETPMPMVAFGATAVSLI